ncbi:plastocyanin/azurin family copper-binding protein [Roseovarius sp. D22-M7]|uniref:plastocyanin/azurin family copper-binding protein n=1 Tax=Roseovarius sp. D22-M7 TaxID=3127116 RepID=UPI0030101DD2
MAGAAMLTPSFALASSKAAAEGGKSVEVMAQGVKFAPAIVFIDVGDTVEWSNMPSHNVETLDGMVPEGQEKIKTELGQNVAIQFDVEGIVCYKCTPHWGNRMGGIIVVGNPEDPAGVVDRYMEITLEMTQHLPARGLLKDLRAELEERGLA